MNRAIRMLPIIVVAAIVFGLTGCEWEYAGEGFDTSQGAGVSFNFTGMYRPKLRSVVAGLPISHFILTQTGNVVEMIDSRNVYLKGTVGAPGVIVDADAAGGYPPGADVAQATMTLSGNGIQFVGVVLVISVTDIQGVTVTETHDDSVVTTETDSESDTETDSQTSTDTDSQTSTDTDGQTSTESSTHTEEDDVREPDEDITEIEIPIYDPVTGEQIGTVTQTTGHDNEHTENDTETSEDTSTETSENTSTETSENTDTSTDEETDSQTTDTTSTKEDSVNVTETTVYTIDESSAMYVLEGNWVEGGNVYAVSAMARANAGGFTLTSN